MGLRTAGRRARFAALRLVHRARDRPYGRVAVQRPDAQLDTEGLLDPADREHRLQRVAADAEEAVPGAHLRPGEHVTEDPGDGPFGRRTGLVLPVLTGPG